MVYFSQPSVNTPLHSILLRPCKGRMQSIKIQSPPCVMCIWTALYRIFFSSFNFWLLAPPHSDQKNPTKITAVELTATPLWGFFPHWDNESCKDQNETSCHYKDVVFYFLGNPPLSRCLPQRSDYLQCKGQPKDVLLRGSEGCQKSSQTKWITTHQNAYTLQQNTRKV